MDSSDIPDNPTRAIYDQIYGAILDHRLGPGTKLRETELSSAFGVSRTLVRQALIQLGQDGIVVLRHNRGAEVAAEGPARAGGPRRGELFVIMIAFTRARVPPRAPCAGAFLVFGPRHHPSGS